MKKESTIFDFLLLEVWWMETILSALTGVVGTLLVALIVL